jgi:hypothetical protein
VTDDSRLFSMVSAAIEKAGAKGFVVTEVTRPFADVHTVEIESRWLTSVSVRKQELLTRRATLGDIAPERVRKAMRQLAAEIYEDIKPWLEPEVRSFKDPGPQEHAPHCWSFIAAPGVEISCDP